jgi:hypothetical protein
MQNTVNCILELNRQYASFVDVIVLSLPWTRSGAFANLNAGTNEGLPTFERAQKGYESASRRTGLRALDLLHSGRANLYHMRAHAKIGVIRLLRLSADTREDDDEVMESFARAVQDIADAYARKDKQHWLSALRRLMEENVDANRELLGEL